MPCAKKKKINPGILDEDLWEKAKKHIGKEGEKYSGDAYWAVVRDQYKKLGGRLKKAIMIPAKLLIKAKLGSEKPGHKYIRREGVPGQYKYIYDEESGKVRKVPYKEWQKTKFKKQVPESEKPHRFMEDKEVLRSQNVAMQFLKWKRGSHEKTIFPGVGKKIEYVELKEFFEKHEKYEDIFEYKDKMWVFLRHLKKKGYEYKPDKTDYYRYPHSKDVKKIWDSLKKKKLKKSIQL